MVFQNVDVGSGFMRLMLMMGGVMWPDGDGTRLGCWVLLMLFVGGCLDAAVLWMRGSLGCCML